MNIKVTENETKSNIPFPKLMKYTDTGEILLMYNFRIGMVVFEEGEFYIGHYSTEWSSENLVDFNGKIELSN